MSWIFCAAAHFIYAPKLCSSSCHLFKTYSSTLMMPFLLSLLIFLSSKERWSSSWIISAKKIGVKECLLMKTVASRVNESFWSVSYFTLTFCKCKPCSVAVNWWIAASCNLPLLVVRCFHVIFNVTNFPLDFHVRYFIGQWLNISTFWKLRLSCLTPSFHLFLVWPFLFLSYSILLANYIVLTLLSFHIIPWLVVCIRI